MNIDLSELDFNEVGDWPKPVKILVVVIIWLAIVCLGYAFHISGEFDRLHQAEQQEATLKQKLELKQRRAVSLPAYEKQLHQIKRSFGNMLQKLPSRTEVPGLLEDISEVGLQSGLSFKLFRPLPERELEFYAELPIEISVVGDYHQLAEFASKSANLSRIVVLGNFNLKEAETDAKKAKLVPLNRERLQLVITARTYRYIDEEEQG